MHIWSVTNVCKFQISRSNTCAHYRSMCAFHFGISPWHFTWADRPTKENIHLFLHVFRSIEKMAWDGPKWARRIFFLLEEMTMKWRLHSGWRQGLENSDAKAKEISSRQGRQSRQGHEICQERKIGLQRRSRRESLSPHQ